MQFDISLDVPLLEAARRVLGKRNFEIEICERTQVAQSCLVMCIKTEAVGTDEISLDQVLANKLGGFEIDDELLIPLYFLPQDKLKADELIESIQYTLSALPLDAFEKTQSALELRPS